MKKSVKVISIIVTALILVVGLFSLIVWLFQGRWIYTNREKDENGDPRVRGDFQNFTKVKIPAGKDKDLRVAGIWIPYLDNLKDGEPPQVDHPVTFILFHGFTNKIGDLLDKGASLSRCVPSNLLMMDYRGYGKSEGSPSEKAFYQDAEAALNWVMEQPNVHPDLIMLYGESDGAAVALQLASAKKKHVLGVIVENPFLASEYEVYHRLWRPLRYFMWWLQTERFDNRKHMHNMGIVHGNSKIPHILSLVSAPNPVIPASHSIELLQQLGNAIGKYQKKTKNKDENGFKDVLVAHEVIEGEEGHRIDGPSIQEKCFAFLRMILPAKYHKPQSQKQQQKPKKKSPKPKQRK